MDPDDPLAAGEDDVERGARISHPKLTGLGRMVEEKHSLGWSKAPHLHETPVLGGFGQRQPDVEARPDGSIGSENGNAAPRQTIQRRIASRASRQREEKDRRPGREPRPPRSSQEGSFPPAREPM